MHPAAPVVVRRRRVVALVVIGVVTAVVAGLLVYFLTGPRVIAGQLTGPSLPWPREGQAAAEIEGLGSLGVSGDQLPVPIASLTKVMTAYVVLQDHPLSGSDEGPRITIDQQTQDEANADGDQSTVWVRAGQQLSERDLLELMLIPSGNNIARLLARWDAGTQAAFVARMNAAASGLGMTQTTYTGASGVENSTVSTATDQLALARAALRNEVIAAIVALPRVHVPGVPGPIVNTNTLLGHNGVIGLKTGSTSAAGGALMWAARAQDGSVSRLIVGVVLYQDSGEDANVALRAALTTSGTLVAAIEQALPNLRAN